LGFEVDLSDGRLLGSGEVCDTNQFVFWVHLVTFVKLIRLIKTT